jgi:hypothetical protein
MFFSKSESNSTLQTVISPLALLMSENNSFSRNESCHHFWGVLFSRFFPQICKEQRCALVASLPNVTACAFACVGELVLSHFFVWEAVWVSAGESRFFSQLFFFPQLLVIFVPGLVLLFALKRVVCGEVGSSRCLNSLPVCSLEF